MTEPTIEQIAEELNVSVKNVVKEVKELRGIENEKEDLESTLEGEREQKESELIEMRREIGEIKDAISTQIKRFETILGRLDKLEDNINLVLGE